MRSKREQLELSDAKSHSWHQSVLIGLVLFMIGFMIAKAIERDIWSLIKDQWNWKYYIVMAKMIM